MTMDGHGFQRLFGGAVWALIALLAASAMLLHARLINEIDLDGGITGDEAEMLYALRAVRWGCGPYHNFHVRPHVIAQYMPLFYLAPVAVAKVFGLGWLGTYIVGRADVYVFWIGVSLAIYGLARQARCSRATAVVAGLMWLAGRLAPEMAVCYRPDSIALFFSLAGLYMYGRGCRLRDGVIALSLLLVAFFHKHSAVAALLAILIFECGQGRRGRALGLLSAWGTVVGTVVVISQVLTDGAFVMNVLGSLATFGGLGHVGFVLQLALLRGGAGFAGGALACATPRRDQSARLLRVYFVIALALAVASSSKFGSGPNYYLEPFAAGCILTGVLLENTRAGNSSTRGRWLGLLLLGLALGDVLDALVKRIDEAPQVMNCIVHHSAIRSEESRVWDDIVARLSKWNGELLIEDPYLALRLGKTPVIINVSNFASLQRNGRFDDGDIVRQIDARGFDAVITTQPLDGGRGFRHFPSHWIERVRANYELAERDEIRELGATFCIYLPTTAGAGTRAARAD